MSFAYISNVIIVILALVLLGVAVLVSVNPVEGQPPANLVDILTAAGATSTLGNSEPSIAVNPANPQQIAVVAFSDNWGPATNAPVWKSDDGGNTWRKVAQIPQPPSGCAGPGDQKIAFNAAGQLFVAELGCTPTDSYIYRQTGAADAALTAGVAYGDDQPHLALDTTQTSPCFNRLYSPWLNFNLAPVRSMDSYSTNSGAAMNAVTVGNSTFANRTTRIAIAPENKAYVIFKTREGSAGVTGFENAHFWVKRSDDCGQTWTALGANGVSVSGAATVQTFFTLCFGDQTFNCINPPPTMWGRARSSDAWIAVDPGGRGVFASYVSRDNSGFGQIYVARSTDQGATWTSTRVTNGTRHSAYPEIAVTDNGTVGVLYIDFIPPTLPSTASIFRHHFAQSFDGGATWADQILQNMDPTTFANAQNGFIWGDYEGLTAYGDTFYGVFTGQSINRIPPQLDPIFFRGTGVFNFTATGAMGTTRYWHTATLLNSGKVLIAGGITLSANAELSDPAAGAFSATGGMSTTRYNGHTASLLPNGNVLIAGGFSCLHFIPAGCALASAEVYDRATGSFASTGAMTVSRGGHSATLLPNGKVLIAGGSSTGNSLATSADTYDQLTGKFTPTGAMSVARSLHTATLLPNGKVLIAGGFGYPAAAELYDPATGTFSVTGSMITPRMEHTATLLPNGKVLIAGGVGTLGYLATAELYDPSTGSFTATGPMAIARVWHTATLLPNGKVLIVGGLNTPPSGRYVDYASAELYDPGIGTFASAGAMATARDLHSATLLPNGKVLIAGGELAFVGALSSAELY